MTQIQIQDFLMFTENMILAEEPLDYEIRIKGLQSFGKLYLESYKCNETEVEFISSSYGNTIKLDMKYCKIMETEDSIIYLFGDLQGDFFKIIFFEEI